MTEASPTLAPYDPLPAPTPPQRRMAPPPLAPAPRAAVTTAPPPKARHGLVAILANRRAQLAQKLTGGLVNTLRQLANLLRRAVSGRAVWASVHQHRLNLNGSNVLADFIVQLAGNLFAHGILGMHQPLGELAAGVQLLL